MNTFHRYQTESITAIALGNTFYLRKQELIKKYLQRLPKGGAYLSK